MVQGKDTQEKTLFERKSESEQKCAANNDECAKNLHFGTENFPHPTMLLLSFSQFLSPLK